MIKVKKITTLIVTAVWMFFIGTSAAQDISQSVVDLINQIRSAPYDQALALGYSAEFLTGQGITPQTQLPAYTNNTTLAGRISPDNTHETKALATNRINGVVTFSNFMDPEDAAVVFVQSQLQNELDSGEFTAILSDTYSMVGVSVTSGTTASCANGWFFSLLLESDTDKYATQLLTVINQVRSKPETIRSYTGKSIDEYISDNQNIEFLAGDIYPPLFIDEMLARAGASEAYYLLNRVYPYDLSADAHMEVDERAAVYGYSGDWLQEHTVVAVYEKGNSTDRTNQIFSTLINGEMATWPTDALVFSVGFEDAGPGLSIQERDATDLAVFQFIQGARETSDSHTGPRVYGVLYLDSDRNQIYTPGEEIINEKICVYDQNMTLIKTVLTDNAGCFTASLEMNTTYFFQASYGGVDVSAQAFFDRDRFVGLLVSP